MKAINAEREEIGHQKAVQARAEANRKGSRGKGIKVARLDSLKQINLNAAGLDIGSAEIWACVPEGRDEVSVRVFQTFTVDLHALVDWLEACGVETVAMESTGVYWIPVYELLEARGFAVYLVNARHVSNVDGKKTDLLDCQSPREAKRLAPTAPHLWLAAGFLPPRRRDGQSQSLCAPSG
jgi:hypothetical protein